MNSLFNRGYGHEYTKYEFKSMKHIYEAKINFSNELRGYLTRLDDLYLLRSTITTIQPYIICRSNLEIDDAIVKIKGRWNYDMNRECFIFDIEELERAKIDVEEVLEGIIDYDRYLEILFANSSMDESIKHIIAHYLVSYGGKSFMIKVKASNAKSLIDRLLRFIPIEFINPKSIFIKELKRYILITPTMPLKPCNAIVDELYLRIDSIYVDNKIDESYTQDAIKFIISMHLLPIEIDRYDEIMEYIMSNYKGLTLNRINTILALSIANARINKQDRLEISNIKYIMELLEHPKLIMS